MEKQSELPVDANVSAGKICFKCGNSKPLLEYYTHQQMQDGHLNKCKSCTRADSKAHSAASAQNPVWVESEKSRQREKYHRLGYRTVHKPTREASAAIRKRHEQKYPEKVAARARTQHMLPVVPNNHLHHWSYRPEHARDVIELSMPEHYILHRFLIYDQTHMMYRRKPDKVLLDSRAEHEEWITEVMREVYA